MADTIREKIIADALVQLAKVTVGNGYEYTMGAPLRAQKTFDPALLPVLVLFPLPEENVRAFGKDGLTVRMRVESFMLYGAINASVVQEKLLGDLRKNLTNPAEVWSTYVDDIAYVEGGPAEQPEADNTLTAAYLLLAIKYKTGIGNPYTQ